MEKKTFKERVNEVKVKTESFWHDHKGTIVKGAIGAAVAVSGFVLFKKACSSVDDEFGNLGGVITGGEKVAGPNTLNVDDQEIAEMLRKEIDIDQTEAAIMGKLEEIRDICADKDIVVNVMAGINGEEPFDKAYIGTEIYKDSVCLKSDW